MANEEKKASVPQAQAKGNAVKRSTEKPGLWARIKKWFRDMRSELKKVVWPTPAQFGKNTGIALVMMAVSAVVLWAFDALASGAINALITLVH